MLQIIYGFVVAFLYMGIAAITMCSKKNTKLPGPETHEVKCCEGETCVKREVTFQPRTFELNERERKITERHVTVRHTENKTMEDADVSLDEKPKKKGRRPSRKPDVGLASSKST